MTPPEPGSRKSRRMLVLLVALTLIAFAPILSVLATYAIATALDCAVDEGSIHPCLIGGLDIGGMLYGMGVMGWLMIPAAPLMLIAIFGVGSFGRPRCGKAPAQGLMLFQQSDRIWLTIGPVCS